jgi:hypothetical protein
MSGEQNRFSISGFDEKLIHEIAEMALPFACSVLATLSVPTFSTAC